ncbi:MAG: hypothetical protein ABJM19_00340 [Marinobacter sp.]|uniref:hypothetical protein n=1 Tax=Marinobacter sp. TaxID=50741 RepID=UPI00329A5B8F
MVDTHDALFSAMEEMRSQLEALGLVERPMLEDKYRSADWFQREFRHSLLHSSAPAPAGVSMRPYQKQPALKSKRCYGPFCSVLTSALTALLVSAEPLPLAETPLRALACALILALTEPSAANAPVEKMGLVFADFEAHGFQLYGHAQGNHLFLTSGNIRIQRVG